MNFAASSFSAEFLATALVVVLVPGTGVLFTVSHSLFRGARAGAVAAFGCTLGILPHMTASLLGLAALLHSSATAFHTLKAAGIAYLLYLAWGMWRSSGTITVDRPNATSGGAMPIVVRGMLINVLNPKLSIFFVAFLPQFVAADAPDSLARMATLGAAFMAMTLTVFLVYGAAAGLVRRRVLESVLVMRWIQRAFSVTFAAFAAKLALTDR